MTVAGNGAPGLGAAENVSRQKQFDSSVMDGSSSSKVTVEYHDPSGLFPLVQEQLTSRLPLRNLHWKSPTRPLRSIDSLHVDLVPSKDSLHISGVTSPGLAPPEGTQQNATSSEITRAPSRERRHQIPGLRQTPYLKVYLLRCDDSDTYKSNARKQLREWVKAHTPPSQSSSSSSTQENHDAFEWMIIHVVIPDTPAASQPRGTAASSAATGEKEKPSATSRWTRGTTTILEKIRADFNISSKSAPDRVAQVRLEKGVVPAHMLPTTTPSVTSPPISESPQEQERVWNDVIIKFKTLILLSFDLRVSQYEEDIREKDSQRALPGWNFCTFFILKEGLARGFESVGLVEDALLGYDELSIGLDSILRDQANDGGEGQGGVILNYSEDLHQQTLEILKRSQKEDGGRKQPQPHIHDESPINSRKKDYRGLILSNNISVFDFRSYIFGRQMSLLLRLGNSHSSKVDLAAKLQPRSGVSGIKRSADDNSVGTKSGVPSGDSEDLLSLSELCTRALNFITFAGRLLRDDLINGATAHETKFPECLVDNIVRSWTFAALEQVLNETATSSLPFTKFQKDSTTGSSGKIRAFGNHIEEQKVSVAEPKTMIHPARSSSLQAGRSASTDPPYAQTAGQVVFDNGQYQDRPVPNQENNLLQIKSGQQDLASTRAQLHVVQRRTLEHVGKSLGWSIGWSAVISTLSHKEELSDIDLNAKSSDEEDSEAAVEDTPKLTSPTVGISTAAIVNAVSSIDQFRQYYESLSDLIVKHYNAAGQVKSGESILGDLAALRFEMGDFAAAAMYFKGMASLFAESRWNTVETMMLKMYAQCLKKLNRKDEYVRTLLDILAKSAGNKISNRVSFKRASRLNLSNVSKDWLDDDSVDTTGLFRELIGFSEQLPYDVTAPMAKYFGDIVVEPYVRHFDSKDGFQLRLQFRHVLEDEVDLRKAKIRLISATAGQGKDIWLESTDDIRCQKGVSRIWLNSNVNTTGPYMVDKIIVEAKRILFVHESVTKVEETTPLGIPTPVSASTLKAVKKSRVVCFPRIESLRARLYLSHFIHIDKPRHIEIECSSGWNDIHHAEFRLKSATAGLRLHTAKTTVSLGNVVIKDKPNPGVIETGNIAANTITTLKLPYELESMLPDLTIKLEVDYVTENGQFQFYSTFAIPVELPLDVNVHDHFKNHSLYSKFNIKTANHVPLEILDVMLESSEEFEVFAPKKMQGHVHVFPKQPMSTTYKITKKPIDASKRRPSRTSIGSLALSVEYRCLDEDILDRVQEFFTLAVENSPVHRLARLLVATFVDRLQHRVLPHQFEKIALLDKIDMGLFEDMGWSECIDSLPHLIREDTRTWLQKWHEKHKFIHLPPSPDTASSVPGIAPLSPNPSRRIIITVSIPQTHILHTASLTLLSPSHAVPHAMTIAVAGQPLMTELNIRHTRQWGSPSSLMDLANISLPDDPIEFVYTIEANPDTWLVAGQRRAQFTAREDEEHKYPIMLIPLKVGNALLPNIEISAKTVSKEEDQKRQSRGRRQSDDRSQGNHHGHGDGEGEDEEQLNCETDYLSYGECVMVVPDVRSSTVGIGEMGSPRSAVWLESTGR